MVMIFASLIPTRCMASRSAVIPALLMFPFIQCHHVCGLAEFGGLRNPDRRESVGAAAALIASPSKVTPKSTRDIFVIVTGIKLRRWWSIIAFDYDGLEVLRPITFEIDAIKTSR